MLRNGSGKGKRLDLASSAGGVGALAPCPAGGGGRPAPRRRSASGEGRLRFAAFQADGALARAWEELELRATLPTQGLAFAAALSGTLLLPSLIEIFFALAPQAGGFAALLPLCRGPGPLARWRILGAREIFEPGDLLCTDASSAALLAAQLARQARPLDLDRIPAASPLVPALREAVRGRAWLSVRPAVPSPTIALDSKWVQPETQFNGGRRSDFRRAARRAEEMGKVSFEMLSPAPDAFPALFDEAVAIEARSWKKEAGSAIAVDPRKEAFFRAFFAAESARGTCRIAFMRIDGKAVAMQLALETQGRYWLFKIGFDDAYARCSPGTLLMLHTIGWAAERKLAAYELLGGVEPWIARFWTRVDHQCVRLRTYPFNGRGAVACALDAIVWSAKALARRRK